MDDENDDSNGEDKGRLNSEKKAQFKKKIMQL